jgi:hypothetical protein
VPASDLEVPGLKPESFDPAKGLTETNVVTLAVVDNPRMRAVRQQAGVAQAQLLEAGTVEQNDAVAQSNADQREEPDDAPTDEVWVTSPGDDSVRILDSHTLQQKAKLTFDGRPEGYAVDAKRGRLYMNYKDKDLTTAIDLKSKRQLSAVLTSAAGCSGR